MKKGTLFENGKFRVETIYNNIDDKKERISAIKKEYGTGGMHNVADENGFIGYKRVLSK